MTPNLSIPVLARLTRAPASLLRSKVSSLALEVDQSWVWPLVKELEGELRRRKILFDPHFWTSIEWFCPDGVPGIAVPFSVLSPELSAFERRLIGHVDGNGMESCRRILRHELGHAIDNAYRLRAHPLRRKVFGAPEQPYPKSYQPKIYSSRYVRHLGMGYAQSHPDEDFAETFAVWFTPAGDWRRRYHGTPALKKLEAMDTLMTEILSQNPSLANRRRIDPVEKCDWTFAQYLNWRWRQAGQHRWLKWDPVLRGLGFGVRGKVRAESTLRRHANDFARELSTSSGLPIYQANMVVRGLRQRAQQLDLFDMNVAASPRVRAKILAERVSPLLTADVLRLYL